MHFSSTTKDNGSKLTKIAIVTALHLAVGAAIVNNMNSKVFSMPSLPDDIVLFTPEPPKPVEPPPEPPKVQPKTAAQPKIVAPKVEVEVPQEPTEPTVQATTAADPVPEAIPGPVVPEAPPATNNTGQMRTAALADANGCAKPDYPASAARNGEEGTVGLALMIGANGRVTDSRIQRSSGSRALDRAALAALSMCQFKPAMVNGVAEPGWGQIAYVWHLN